MSRSTGMHGTFSTGDVVDPRTGKARTFTGWFHRSGWQGHARIELARRRRRNKAARLARRRNRVGS